MKKIYTLIICLGFLQMTYGQVATNYNAKWFFGVNTGLTWQTTDVSNKTNTGWGLTLGKSFNYHTASLVSFDIRGRFLRGFWYGQDRKTSDFLDPNQALSQGLTNYKDTLGYAVHNFQAENYLLNLELVAHANRFRERTRWDPYIFAGIGLNWNQTFGDYLNRDKITGDLSQYNWDVNDLSRKNIKATQDGVYETALDGSSQDNFNFFTSSSLGFGLGYQVGRAVTIGMEHKTTFTNIDDFDGFKSNSKSGNDIYHYTNAFIRFRLFGGSKKEEVVNQPKDENQPPIVQFTQPNSTGQVVNNPNYTIQANIKNVFDRQNVVSVQNGTNNTNFSYNPKTDLFAANVILVEGQNNFVLTGNNQYGTDTKSIVIIYKPEVIQPPVVRYIQPAVDPTTVTTPTYNLTGNVSNVKVQSGISVLVNGVNRTDFNFNMNNGNVLITLNLVPGANTIQITGTNTAGMDSKTTVIIYKVETVKTPPVVYFTDPSNANTTVGVATYVLKAKVQNVEVQSGVNFSQNGANKTNFTFNPNTDDFTFNADLAVGQNTFVLTGTNADGSATATTVIVYNRAAPKPPVVNITNPSTTSASVNLPQYPFIGSIQNINSQGQANMQVNGSNFSGFSFNPTTGVVTANLTLNPGVNTIKLTGTNADGTDNKQVSIVYTPVVATQPPVVYFTSPATSPTNVSNSTYVLKAKVLNVDGAQNIVFKRNGMNQSNFTYNASTNDFESTYSLSSGVNTFELTGTNSAGNASATTVINYQMATPKPPVVNITNPNGSASTSVPNFAFVGNIQNVSSQSQVSMLLNGNLFNAFNFSSSTGAVTANLPLIAGSNTVKLTGTNADGTDNKQVTIVYTPVVTINPPVVTYIDPSSNPFNVNAASYNVRATVANVSAPSGVNIKHNGNTITVFTFGSNNLSFNLNLIEGANVIIVTGTNAEGVDAKTTTIVYTKPIPLAPPTIAYVNPSSPGTTVSANQYTVKATILEISTQAQISLKVNGAVVSPSKYTFNATTHQLSYPVTLNAGTNTFEITATNAGGSANQSTNIVYTAPPCDAPVITATSPNSAAFTTDKDNIPLTLNVKNVTSSSQITVKIGSRNAPFQFNATTGTLTANVTLNVGTVPVTIIATNNCGLDQFVYQLTRTACEVPTLALNFANVGNNQTTFAPDVTLVYNVQQVTSASQISVKMGTKNIAFDLDAAKGTIEVQDGILVGTSVYTITATNSCGTKSMTHTVTRDKSPTKVVPTVAIINPSSSPTTIAVGTFTLQFNTTQIIDQAEIIVRVNGEPTPVVFNKIGNNGTAALKLDSGSNTVKVTVKNPVGTASETTVIVNTGKSGFVGPKSNNQRGN